MDTLVMPSQRHGRSRSMSKSASSPTSSLDKKDYAIGVGLLLVVVLLWTSSNFLTQDLFEGGYEKPFLVTYLNTSSFSLYLVPFFLRKWWYRHRAVQQDEEVPRGRSREEYQPLVQEPDTDSVPSPSPNPPEPITAASDLDLAPLTVRETAKLAFIFCFFWFIANWSVNASLDYTSVASATILSSMSGFFTLGIGRLFRVEVLTVSKIVAVLTSFTGVLLVSLSDSTQTMPASATPAGLSTRSILSPRPILGDSLALLSAVFYALYVILLKVRIRNESRIDMQLFFGFVGLFNTLSCWPIGIVLHFIGAEPFELPTSRRAIAAILINMFITLSSDYIYVLAMLKTTPLVVTVGLSLTIPLAVVGDFFLSRPSRTQVIIGAVLVLVSFIIVGVVDQRNGEDLLEDNMIDDGRGTQSQLRLAEEVSLEQQAAPR